MSNPCGVCNEPMHEGFCNWNRVSAHIMRLESQISDLTRQLEEARREVERLKVELNQRRGWQYCRVHKDINADNAWGCPECVHEMRIELGQLKTELDRRTLRETNLTAEKMDAKTVVVDGE